MNTSETMVKLTEALIKSRKEITAFPKDKKGYGYNYTDLSTIISGITPLLLDNGIILLQPLSYNEQRDYVAITTRLQHISGEYIEDTYNIPLPSMKGTNITQEMGAAITYGRRYAISSMLGLSTEDDTDGTIKPPKNKTLQESIKKLIQDATDQEDLRLVYQENKDKVNNPAEFKKLLTAKKQELSNDNS